MAVKRKIKKKARVAEEKETATSKITLPAFGLAEDILGTKSADSEKQIEDKSGIPNEPALESLYRGQSHAEGHELHLVTFNLDREEYGVDIGLVQEIIRVGQITAVPNAPEFIRGVINLRGKIIPVLSLRKRLNLPEESLTKNSRIMVVESGPKVLGMLVDSVSQVLRMPEATVDPPPVEVEQTRAFVKGIGKVDSRLIMIMELDKVLAKENQAASVI